MYCHECGNQLKENELFCGKCGAQRKNIEELHSEKPKSEKSLKKEKTVVSDVNKNKKREDKKTGKINLKSDKLINKKKFRLIIVAVSIVLIIGIIALVISIVQANLVVRQFDKDENILKSKDIDKINQLVFSTPVIPDELKEYIEPTNVDEIGIMADLLSLAEYEFISKTETTITIEIKAPNMMGFNDYVLTENDSKFTEKEIKEMILDYAKNSKTQITEVTLNYTIVNGEAIINYNTPEFLNAITGNIAESYAEIYVEYISGLLQEVSYDD